MVRRRGIVNWGSHSELVEGSLGGGGDLGV